MSSKKSINCILMISSNEILILLELIMTSEKRREKLTNVRLKLNKNI